MLSQVSLGHYLPDLAFDGAEVPLDRAYDLLQTAFNGPFPAFPATPDGLYFFAP